MNKDLNINIQPANRVAEIKEYYFSKKLREVAAMNAAGADIISLGIGGPDIMPPAAVIDTLSSECKKEDSHSYQPYVGIPELRHSFAGFYNRHFGVNLNPENEILPLIGSKEGILHITMAFVNPGNGVLIPDPGYPTYTSVSKLAGAKIFKYSLAENNHWQPDFAELENLPLEKVKLMWVNYPNMPTGASASKELFEKLVDFGIRHHIVIVNDNPYSFILNDNPMSILSVDNADKICIEMNSLSKTFNMAGWRIGMAAGNKNFIEWIIKVKSNIDSGQFKPMMKAAVCALSQPEEWFATLNQEYSNRRKIAEKIMLALNCSFDKKQKGLFLWGKIPDSVSSGEELTEKILHRAKVFITPGFIFGKNGERYIRISLCASQEKLEEALNRIKATE